MQPKTEQKPINDLSEYLTLWIRANSEEALPFDLFENLLPHPIAQKTVERWIFNCNYLYNRAGDLFYDTRHPHRPRTRDRLRRELHPRLGRALQREALRGVAADDVRNGPTRAPHLAHARHGLPRRPPIRAHAGRRRGERHPVRACRLVRKAVRSIRGHGRHHDPPTRPRSRPRSPRTAARPRATRLPAHL